MGLIPVAILMIAEPLHTAGIWNFNRKNGMYRTAEVGVGDNMNWRTGSLYSPVAYAEGIILTDY